MTERGGSFVKLIRGLRKGLCRVEDTLVCALLLAMVVVAAVPIVHRLAELKWNMMWADPLQKHLVLWIALLGAASATKDRHHINIDVLGRLLRGRAKCGSQAVTDLFSAVVCAMLAYACAAFVQAERESFIHGSFASSGTLFWKVAAWHAQAVMPFAFGLMACRFLIQTVEDVFALVTGAKAGESEEPAPSPAEDDQQPAGGET